MIKYLFNDRAALALGDCFQILKTIPSESVDAVVTDPPYGLEFMGAEWDAFKKGGGVGWKAGQLTDTQGLPDGNVFKEKGFDKLPAFRGMTDEQRETFQGFCLGWARECLRVLKPGGHLLSFGGTRTYHRMACAIEDVGFEVRDSLHWIYGSGFPKSLNVAIAIDKEAGVMGHRGKRASFVGNRAQGEEVEKAVGMPKHEPITDGAKQWNGWGTALKPAHEPVVVARKPLVGTVAANVQRHGTGALNIDGCRVASVESTIRLNNAGTNGDGWGMGKKAHVNGSTKGRWPPNILFSHTPECGEACAEDCAVAEMDRQSGGASRFFPVFRYQAKAPTKERKVPGFSIQHPTQKPIDLMRWLVRLVTPRDGIVLDPFMGSGTTGIAALREGASFIGIEQSQDYYAIAEARVQGEEEEKKDE